MVSWALRDDPMVGGAFFDHQRAVVDGQVHFVFQVVVDRNVADTKERAFNMAVFFEIGKVAFGGVYRNGEADVLSAKDDSGVDADGLAS